MWVVAMQQLLCRWCQPCSRAVASPAGSSCCCYSHTSAVLLLLLLLPPCALSVALTLVPQTTKDLLLLLSPVVDTLAMQQGRVDGAPLVLQLTSQLAGTGWEIGAQRVPRLLLPARV